VLLKNDGVLPLAGKHARIAVVGPYADSTQVLYGSYSSGLSSPPVSVADGLRAALPDADIEVVASGPLLGNADVVPTTALRTPGGEPGLLAAYYSAEGDIDRDLETASDAKSVIGILMAASYDDDPAHTQIDPQINMPFRVAPPPGVTNPFRVVWKGFLVPEVAGTYQLGIHGIATSMSFNGEPFVTTTTGDPIALKTLRLEASHPYPIEVSARKSVVAVARLLWKRVSEQPEADAVAAAKQADLVVAVVGINSTLESEESAVVAPGFDRGDRTSLGLPADQLALLAAVKETGKPLVVVSMSGSPLDLSWAQENANALLHAWYPGQEGGHAVADILTGKENPAGRLPVTFYRSVADLPSFNDYSMQNRTYRYFRGTPLYPFGYGLSYTRFEYSAPALSRDGDTHVVTVKVSNVGERDGDEVVQLYLRFPQSPDVPNLALRGFQRVHVRAGESRDVEFRLAPRNLGSVTGDGEHRVLAGEYEVIVGGGQPETGAPIVRADLQVERTVPLPP
jgi:beta-glucosidase